MILSSRSAKAGEKSLRKLVDLLVEVVFIYVIIDFETSDYSEATSSSESLGQNGGCVVVGQQ
jgi:hypothetical protein